MAKKAKNKKAPESTSFEESIAELAQVVRELEEGQLSLDDSLERYEQGIRFVKQCQKILAAAERKIEVLSGVDADGNPALQRFDDQELSLEEKADQRSRRRSASTSTPPRAKQARSGSSVSDQDDVDENGTLF